MSDSDVLLPVDGPRDFREAFAQWRLAAHAEVKRASSLPTAMFDAMDPMLEMQLAETTEEMLAKLGRPQEHLTRGAEGQERRLEFVDREELRRVAARIAEHSVERVDLLEDLSREFLGVLAEACGTECGAVRRRAATQICRAFGVTLDNLEEVITDVREIAQETWFRREADSDRAVIANIERELRAALLAGVAPDQEGQP